jgi:repressor LexA
MLHEIELDDKTTQVAALRWIADSIEMKKYPPSMREIGTAVGCSSSSTAHNLVKNLKRRGWIEYEPKIARSMRITDSGFKLLEDSEN